MAITQANNGQRLFVNQRATATGIITALTINRTNSSPAYPVSVTATVELLHTLASLSIDTRDLTGPGYNPVSGGGSEANLQDLVSISGQILSITGNGETASLVLQLDYSGQVTVGAQDCAAGGGQQADQK